jgi:hypothetical protein
MGTHGNPGGVGVAVNSKRESRHDHGYPAGHVFFNSLSREPAERIGFKKICTDRQMRTMVFDGANAEDKYRALSGESFDLSRGQLDEFMWHWG